MAGAVNIRLGAIVSDFVAGFRTAQAAAGQLATQLNGNLSAGFAAADRQSRQFERGIGKLGSTMQTFGGYASIVSAGIAAIGVASFRTYGDIDGIQRALKVTAGSAQEAGKQFKEFVELSKLPGLGLSEVVQAGLQLETLGYQAQTAQKYVAEVGNAIALGGKGKVEFDSVITQFVQMAGKAKVLGDDLKPIITASPVIAKAIQNMFGTVDSEQISARLQAVGRNSKDFINDLVINLSKLERVEGGPKNAIENLGDSLKLAQFNFGQAADKAFGLTAIIDRVGNTATSLSERFSTLSPVTQKIILGVTGLAVAIGPLAVGLGGILALVPSVIAGAAALTTTLGIAIGPILGIGVAIVGLVAIVAFNWESIKTVLTDSGIWQSVTGLAASAFDFIGAAFKRFVQLLQFLWNRFGGFFIGFGKTVFEAVAGVFRFFAGLLTGIFKALTGILTLDWFTFLDGIKTIAKSFLGLIVDAFKLMVASVGRSIGAIFQLFGGESLAEKITSGVDKALGKLDKLKGSIQSVATATKATATIAGTTPGKTNNGNKKTEKPFDYLNSSLGTKSEIKKAQEELKKLKEAISSGKLAGKDVSALQTQYDILKSRIDSATSSFKKLNSTTGSLNPTLTTNERILKRLTQQLKEQGDTADKSRSQMVALFQEKVRQDKELANFKPVDLGELKPITTPLASNRRVGDILNAGGATTAGIGGSSASIGLPGLAEFQQKTRDQIRDAQLTLTEDKQRLRFTLSDIPNIFGSLKDEMNRVIASDPFNSRGLITSVLASTQAISDAIKSAKANLVSGGIDLLAGIGEGLASGQLSFKGIIKSVIDMIADSVIAIGKVMITTGIPLSLFPATAALGFKQILTGGAIVLAGGVAKGLASSLLSDNVKGFAKGGLFRSSSLINVGENSRATSGGLGEWVSPVGLGADLISERIMKTMGLTTPKVNTPDMRQVSRPIQRIELSGKLTADGRDLSYSFDQYNESKLSFN